MYNVTAGPTELDKPLAAMADAGSHFRR
jgi:hypothetical protein